MKKSIKHQTKKHVQADSPAETAGRADTVWRRSSVLSRRGGCSAAANFSREGREGGGSAYLRL